MKWHKVLKENKVITVLQMKNKYHEWAEILNQATRGKPRKICSYQPTKDRTAAQVAAVCRELLTEEYCPLEFEIN